MLNKVLFRRLLHIGGLDIHVLLTLLFRSWSVIAGGLMVVLVPLWFTRIEQGYYYAFASLIALQIFFELGMNQIVVQVASHETANLRMMESGAMQGAEEHISRLASLARLLWRWYKAAAFVFWIAVSIAGALFFHTQGELSLTQWLPPWLVLVACTAINLLLSPSLALLEGFGEVGAVARARLVQSIGGYVLMWIALSTGAGLWAVPLIPMAAAAYTTYWLHTRAGTLHWLRTQIPRPGHRIDWRTEILPFQWRIAVSWISGYFIFQLFVPLIFSHQGAAEAGRIGIALAIFNALVNVSMSWVNAKLPEMSRLIALGNRTQLNALFLGVGIRSVGFAALSSAVVVIAVAALGTVVPTTLARIAGVPVMALLAAASVVNSAIFAMAIYMRAHREEPMLPVSVAGAAATIPCVYFGSYHSVLMTVGLYFAVAVLLSLPWTSFLFNRYFHRPAR